jgi:integrase
MAVREWIAALIDDGPGASRIRGAHAVLSMVLDSPVDTTRLATNHAAGVRGLPRRPEIEMHFLTEVQVEHLATAIDPRHSTLVRLGAYTGLRPGEILGLKVKRLNLVRGTARVAEALTEVNGKLTWGTPKTHERRTVRLPRFLCEEVGAYLAGRPSDPEDLVITAPRGGPIREHKLMERYFKPAAVRLGLPAALRMHDLRHTAASLLIREGASIKALQKQLGHKDAVQTLNRYGHLYPDELDSLAERLQEVHARAFGGGDRPSADRARLDRGPDRKSRRSVTCGCGGGGGTRTPVPWRRPRASPSAATGCISDLGCPAAPHPGPSPLECSRARTGTPSGWSLLSTPYPLPQARSGGRLPKRS